MCFCFSPNLLETEHLVSERLTLFKVEMQAHCNPRTVLL